jgi:hypothetical protein
VATALKAASSAAAREVATHIAAATALAAHAREDLEIMVNVADRTRAITRHDTPATTHRLGVTALATTAPLATRYIHGQVSLLPVPTEQGYSPPSVRQFAVFLDNKVGKLLELLKLFDDDATVHVAALSVIDSSDYAVVRMIFSNADAARHLLRKHNYTFSELDLIIVQIAKGQSLTKMCLFLLGAELNIRFVYPVLMRAAGEPCVALAVDDYHLAGQILMRKRFTLLGEEDLT